MLERTGQFSTVEEKDLGIGLQFSVNLGKGSMTFTAGFPLDWDDQRINGLVDKLSKVIDRQSILYEIHDREAAIKNMMHQIEVQLSQRDRYDRELQVSFATRGKHGNFKYSNEQIKNLNNYDKSVAGLRDAIAKSEAELKELREKCL